MAASSSLAEQKWPGWNGKLASDLVSCVPLGHVGRHRLKHDDPLGNRARAFGCRVGHQLNLAVDGVVEVFTGSVGLPQIKEDGVSWFRRRKREQAGRFRAGAVTGDERHAVGGQSPFGNLQPGAPTRLHVVCHRLAGLES